MEHTDQVAADLLPKEGRQLGAGNRLEIGDARPHQSLRLALGAADDCDSRERCRRTGVHQILDRAGDGDEGLVPA